LGRDAAKEKRDQLIRAIVQRKYGDRNCDVDGFTALPDGTLEWTGATGLVGLRAQDRDITGTWQGTLHN
jgi:hypothetical protein